MNFRTWLLRQAKRDDPVGDLARDLKEDSTIGEFSLTKFETQYHMCDLALAALHRARREYKAVHGKVKRTDISVQNQSLPRK